MFPQPIKYSSIVHSIELAIQKNGLKSFKINEKTSAINDILSESLPFILL